MTGHLLTGAAAVEALACIIAMDRQATPPTINLDHPDPEVHDATSPAKDCFTVAVAPLGNLAQLPSRA